MLVKESFFGRRSLDLECLNEFAVQLSDYFWLKAKETAKKKSKTATWFSPFCFCFLFALVRAFFVATAPLRERPKGLSCSEPESLCVGTAFA